MRSTALVAIGARRPDNTPVGMLTACHERIREHLALARRLAREHDHSREDVREAAQRLVRYFGVALPLHIADEDLSIAPRLIKISPVLEITLDVLENQHHAHESTVEWLVSLCGRLEAHPEELAATRAILGQTVELLTAQFATHLEIEEQVVFPAINRLPADEQLAIVREIRERRAAH